MLQTDYVFDFDTYLHNEHLSVKRAAEAAKKAVAPPKPKPLPAPSHAEQRGYIAKVAKELGFVDPEAIADEVLPRAEWNAERRSLDVGGKAIQLHLRELAKTSPELAKPDGEARVALTLEEVNVTGDFALLDTPLLRQQFHRRYGARFSELATAHMQKEREQREQLARQNADAEWKAWRLELERRRSGSVAHA